MATFSASTWVRTARELGATHASLFAAPIRMILARCAADERPLSLEHVWFAQSLGETHYDEFSQLVGTAPRQLYGMTETIAAVTTAARDQRSHDVIGRAVNGRGVRLVTASGAYASTGEPGELWVRGSRGEDLFLGYLDAPQADEAAFVADGDGVWFRTGDVASRRGDGTLRFVGRVDDVIKVAGENVSLTQIEAAVAQAPGVLEAAVVARPDPVRDHVPVAFIVPKDPAAPPSLERLAAWADANLAPASRPREWTVIDELPRTSVGKVRRFKIGAERQDQP